MDEIILVQEKIKMDELKKIAEERLSNLLKTVVDIEKNIMAIGGYMHADEEQLLLEMGSKQENLWGINILFNKPRDSWIEFDSMINVRPRQNNLSRGVEDPKIRKAIINIVNNLLKE